MLTTPSARVPNPVKLLATLGDAGQDIFRRLQKADELISQAQAGSGFAHPLQRQRLRQLRETANSLRTAALADALSLLQASPSAPKQDPAD